MVSGHELEAFDDFAGGEHLTALNAEGVQLQSPGSPRAAAPWEIDSNKIGYAEGVTQRTSIPTIPFINLDTVLLAQSPKLVLIRLVPMMFLLVDDVFVQSGHVRRAHRKCAVSVLPMKLGQSGFDPLIHFEESRFNSRIKVETSIVFDKRQRI